MTCSRRKTSVALGSILLVALLALAFSAPAPARPKEDAVREFGPASMFEGKTKERGQAYGKQFRDAIRAFLQKEMMTDSSANRPRKRRCSPMPPHVPRWCA